MVSVENLIRYCSGDITKIENYNEAVNDQEVMWECHHRREELGYSAQELIKMNRYYKVPPEDLILLTPKEHRRLHNIGREFTDEHKKKLSEANTGKKCTEDTKKKMSEAHIGKYTTPKIHCKELNKTFDSYKACNHYMAKYLGLKQFNVGYIIKHQNGYYKKHNLYFYEK